MTKVTRQRKPIVAAELAALPATPEVQAKPAAPVAQAKKKAEAPAEAAKVKNKLVRDSFTMPKAEYEVLAHLKQRGTKLERHVKKSELLRAGIAALAVLSDKGFLAALDRVPSLKTGRPKADKTANGAAE